MPQIILELSLTCLDENANLNRLTSVNEYVWVLMFVC